MYVVIIAVSNIFYIIMPFSYFTSKQKLEERSASLSKMKFADAKDREKWEKVMTIEFISSEDSGSDNDDEVLIVRPLPWRSARVDHMFINNLDKQSIDNKSPLAKRQMMRRVLGLHSH